MGIDPASSFWLDDGMTTTTAPKIIWKTGRYADGGANRQDGPLEIVRCRECGSHIVWCTSKRTGKKYRVSITRGEADQAFYMKNNVHTCDPEAVRLFALQNARMEAEAMQTGAVTRGCRARIVKGRKYPVGTEGNVFWVADEADGYGVVKVGMTTDAGEKVWVNIANLERVEVI